MRIYWVPAKTILVLSIFILTSLCLSASTGASDKPLLFLGNQQLPPMIYMQKGKAIGIVVDLAEAMAKNMDHPVKFEYMDWADAQRLVLDGKADALLHINPTDERQAIFDFSGPLLESEFSIFVRSEKEKIFSIKDLRGLRVGVEGKGASIDYISRESSIEPVVIPDIPTGFQFLADGKIDAVVVDQWVGAYVLAENGMRGIRVSGEPIAVNDSAIAVKKGNARLLAEIDQALSKIRQDGTYNKILTRWKPKEVIFQTRSQHNQEKILRIVLMCALVLALGLSGGMYNEIRKRKKAEKVLKASENEFRLLFAANPSPMFVFDEKTLQFLTVNDAALAKYGYSQAEFLALTILDIRPPEDRVAVFDIIQRYKGAHEAAIGSFRHIGKDGTIMDMAITVSSINFAGRPGRLCLMTDVTERKQADEALRDSERKYRNLFENMAEEVHFWQLERDEVGNLKTWRLVDVNPPALKSWGRKTAKEIVGKTTEEIFGPGATEHYLPIVQQIFSTGMPHNFEDYFPNLDKYFRFTSVPFDEFFITTGADITTIKKTEEALRDSEARFRLALKNAPVSVAAQDLDLKYIWAYNQRTARPEDIIGHYDRDPFIPKEAAYITGLKNSVIDEGIELREQMWFNRSNGRIFLDVCWEPIRNQSGQVIGVATATVDLTPLKQAEEELKTSLSEKEVLLKEIHHRVKNNMQVISSLVDLQANQVNDPDMRAIFQDITCRVRSMAMVHEKLYQSVDLAQVDFADYTQSLVAYLWRAQGQTASGIELKLDVKPVMLPVTTAVPCGLILNELFGNALKHAFNGRKSGAVKVSLGEAPDKNIHLSVSDDGVGLAPGLDWEQSGSLGLRIVKMLARQINARIEVVNDNGTRFTIQFEREIGI